MGVKDLSEFKTSAEGPQPVAVVLGARDTTITRVGLDGKPVTLEAKEGDKIYRADTIQTGPQGIATLNNVNGDSRQRTIMENVTTDGSYVQSSMSSEHLILGNIGNVKDRPEMSAPSMGMR